MADSISAIAVVASEYVIELPGASSHLRRIRDFGRFADQKADALSGGPPPASHLARSSGPCKSGAGARALQDLSALRLAFVNAKRRGARNVGSALAVNQTFRCSCASTGQGEGYLVSVG